MPFGSGSGLLPANRRLRQRSGADECAIASRCGPEPLPHAEKIHLDKNILISINEVDIVHYVAIRLQRTPND
jgi:hypothetical protein